MGDEQMFDMGGSCASDLPPVPRWAEATKKLHNTSNKSQTNVRSQDVDDVGVMRWVEERTVCSFVPRDLTPKLS